MTIQVLGIGCPKCVQLTSNVRQALTETGVEAEVVKVTKMADIAKMGALATPALAIDGVLKSSGKVLTPEQIKALLV